MMSPDTTLKIAKVRNNSTQNEAPLDDNKPLVTFYKEAPVYHEYNKYLSMEDSMGCARANVYPWLYNLSRASKKSVYSIRSGTIVYV